MVGDHFSDSFSFVVEPLHMMAAFLAAAFAVPASGIHRNEPQHLLGQWMLSKEGLVSNISAAEIFTRVQDYSMATLNYDEDTARKIEFTPGMIMSVGSGLEGREVISVQSPDKKDHALHGAGGSTESAAISGPSSSG